MPDSRIPFDGQNPKKSLLLKSPGFFLLSTLGLILLLQVFLIYPKAAGMFENMGGESGRFAGFISTGFASDGTVVFAMICAVCFDLIMVKTENISGGCYIGAFAAALIGNGVWIVMIITAGFAIILTVLLFGLLILMLSR